ncbi:hypothetical protein LF817_05935 [Halobacillus sp. A1]|uniref:Phosphoesterase n=1 Tax=Halobacillus campisalis TaxID=435909 RepID=A0ABW2JZ85_9BACI|nr:MULTISPECIES: hypothetical protein [Halobacillus]MCP3030879.1 hypothetical protein [Halobacillus sp. A1]
MEEPVGPCVSCGKTVYCKDGFLDGVITHDRSLLCTICAYKEEKES